MGSFVHVRLENRPQTLQSTKDCEYVALLYLRRRPKSLQTFNPHQRLRVCACVCVALLLYCTWRARW